MKNGEISPRKRLTPIGRPDYTGETSRTASPSYSGKQSNWYYSATVTEPASSYSSWYAGVPYVVPAGRRFIVEFINVSSNVAGVVQELNLVEETAVGTLYMFLRLYFDTHGSANIRVPLSTGSKLYFTVYNNDIAERKINVKIDGFEEEV